MSSSRKLRYYLEPFLYRNTRYSRRSLCHWLFALINACRKCWWGGYTINGYTLVLRKQSDPSR